MTDIVPPKKRSQMMAGIRGTNTKPELLVRSALHKRGLRYRLHDKQLPGKPDIVLKKHAAVIFVHGCFWHKHNCRLFKWPKSNPDFWRSKISANSVRDRTNIALLKSMRWRVFIVWECSIRNKTQQHLQSYFDQLTSDIRER